MIRPNVELTFTLQEELTQIKFGLLAQGARIARKAKWLISEAKGPIRTRSGVSGGLDIILPHKVYVNVPVNERFASRSRFVLDALDDELIIVHDGVTLTSAELQPIPNYYSLRTRDNSEDMVRIGQMCSGDRFCYGMTGPGCSFWGKSKRCAYCSIGDNYQEDASRKRAEHLLEVLEEAVNDPSLPAKHILLGGGTPPTEDMGAILASELCRLIKRRFDIRVYVMIVAPLKDTYIDTLFDAGVDELGMNLEFWSDDAWRRFIPGKNSLVGKQRYLESLEYAVSKFGPINTRSILIAGLEDGEETIQGATRLAQMGVMPIISPFRPLNNTLLEDQNGFDSRQYLTIYQRIAENLSGLEVPIGPTCISCQNNVLAMPFGSSYRLY